MLVLPRGVCERLVAHCVHELPMEGCGLLVGEPVAGTVADAVATANVARSALRYEIDPAEHLRADRRAEAAGLEVIGGYHSHTHTDAYPSATDVAAAVDPSWHWVVVSLRRSAPVVRSFRIEHGGISEEAVVIR